MRELHLLIIWNNALSKKDLILDKIGSEFKILYVDSFFWADSDYFEAIKRFYFINDKITEHKINNIGIGSFLLVIVEDENPIYEYRKTVYRNTELVNTNVFDLKMYFRSLFDKPDIIHGTNNLDESFRDIMFFLGKDVFYFFYEETLNKYDRFSLDYEPKRIDAKNEMFSYNSLNHNFKLLEDKNIKYVVIRNWHLLPQKVVTGEHFDLDILTDNALAIIKFWELEKVDKQDNTRSQYKLRFLDNGNISWGYVDLRTPNDNYFPSSFSIAILKNRIKYKSFYTPNKFDHVLGLLYHSVFHKGYVSEEYVSQIDSVYPNIDFYNSDLVVKLLNDNNIFFSMPIDKSVCRWSKLGTPFNLNRDLISYRLLDKQNDQEHFSRVYRYRRKKLICKESSREIGLNEVSFLNRMLHSNYVPKLFEYEVINNEFVRMYMQKLEGKLLGELDLNSYFKSATSIINLSIHFINILIDLVSNNVIHRDIHLDNIIIVDRLPILIDFGWAVDFSAADSYVPFGLGGRFRPYDSYNKFSDAYSISVILKENFYYFKQIRSIIDNLASLHKKGLEAKDIEEELIEMKKRLSKTRLNLFEKFIFKIKQLLFIYRDNIVVNRIHKIISLVK